LLLGIFLFTSTCCFALPAGWTLEGGENFSISVSLGDKILIAASREVTRTTENFYLIIPVPPTEILPGDRFYILGDVNYKTDNPDSINWGVNISPIGGGNMFFFLSDGSVGPSADKFDLEEFCLEIWNWGISSMSITIDEMGIERDKIRYPFVFSNTTGIETSNTPTDFALHQNYPNPFNATTKIEYSVARNGNVTLTVYDILGKEIAILVNEIKPAGSYSVNFDTHELASGTYFYKLNNGSRVLTQKMMLVK
jgi:hypothetical protein